MGFMSQRRWDVNKSQGILTAYSDRYLPSVPKNNALTIRAVPRGFQEVRQSQRKLPNKFTAMMNTSLFVEKNSGRFQGVLAMDRKTCR